MLPIEELRAVFGAMVTEDSGVSVEQVYEPVASATSGIWRVRAEGRTAILKLVAQSEGGHVAWQSGLAPGHWYYWRREIDAYESGLLESFDGGLRAPTCQLVAARPDESVALWLEDLTGTPATAWELGRYEVASAHLGRMQGAYLAARPLPRAEWLSRNWLRHYLSQRDGDMTLVADATLWDQSLIAPWFARPPIERVQAMREGQPLFLDALDHLPHTLCHLDLHPANLFDDGNARTVAIDWAFVGLGALGEDAGNLVVDAVLDFHVDPAVIDDLYACVATGYEAGLRAAGWKGSFALVRLGMAATIAAKYAWIAPAILRAVSEDRELLNGRPIAEAMNWWAPAVAFLLDRADEARDLISQL